MLARLKINVLFCLIAGLALAVEPLSARAQQDPTPSEDGEFSVMRRKAKHWAWQPLVDLTPQASIDDFVNAVLAERAIQPAQRAAAGTLFRRLSFDLTGLPPAPAALRNFLADRRPDAWERAVDQQLASPAFGEHWARHWMDLVRYSETLGHEFDFAIPGAWRYRDYLIRAFNQDLPYDQLVREHIAGDLLEAPRRHADGFEESPIGTAFWWFAEQTHSPVDLRQHSADRIGNQIDVLSKTFLGMTVACARCHDHKFDAISTADYYAMSGYLRSSRYLQHDIAPRASQAQRSEFERARQALVDGLQKQTAAHAQEVETSEDGAIPHPEETSPDLKPSSAYRSLADFRQDDHPAWFIEGAAFDEHPTTSPQFVHSRHGHALLPTGCMSSAGRGASAQGVLHSPSFVIDQRWLHISAAGFECRIAVYIEGFQVLRAPIYGGLKRIVNSADLTWHSFDLGSWRGERAWIAAIDQTAVDLGESARRDGYSDQGFVAVQRVLLSADPQPPRPNKAPAPNTAASLRRALDSWQNGTLSAAQAARLHKSWGDRAESDATTLRPLIAALEAAEAAMPKSIFVPAIADGDGLDHPIYIRGDHAQPRDIEPRRFLSAYGGPQAPLRAEPGSGRLQLADAVLNTPLAPRVFVNRVWHHLFGRGLVSSVDNFGVLGTRPTHPKLLDFLASRCLEEGWSLKALIRRIVTSEAYCRSSRCTDPTADAADPEITTLHRARIRRLPAESIRDAVLAVSGALSPLRFGRSVPPHITAHMTGRGKPRSGPLDGAGRRSVYQRVARNFLPPFLLAFDMPIPAATVGRRDMTNVPAQALAMLNDPFVIEQSARWADGVASMRNRSNDSGGANARIDAVMLRGIGRLPSAEERALIREQLQSWRSEAQAEFEASARTRDQQIEQQAWQKLCHAIYNLEEFVFLR